LIYILFFLLRTEFQLIANVNREVVGAANILSYRQQHMMVFGYVDDGTHSVSGGIVAVGRACCFVIEFRSQRQRFIDVALNQPPELPPVLVSLAGINPVSSSPIGCPCPPTFL
jgi:hypothetical protein